jgi:L-malate glycosyltransferase
MRILYFSRDYTPHDHRFLSSLAQTEHEVLYLRLERRGHILEDRPLPSQVEQIQWGGGLKPIRLKDGFRLCREFKSLVHMLKPDIVHAGPIQTTALMTAVSGFRRLVSMSWGYDLLRDANRGLLWRWATRYALKRSASLVVDCETVRRQAEAFGMDANRIVVFAWGVDLDHFKPADNKRSAEDPLAPFSLLSTRSWEPIYGVEILAQAFALVAENYPQLRLVMTGNGSLASKLRQIFQKSGVLDRVSFPGHVSQVDLPRFYQAADLYISTSHIDGASISMLEALACGCPVLVSDIPGNMEWVTPGEQGWVFSDGDPRQLADLIAHAIQSRSKLVEMGRAARSLAQARANWRVNFAKLERAYQMAVN